MKNNKGFTLVELLAVIAILAILVILAIPSVIGLFNSSKKSLFETEAKEIFSVASSSGIKNQLKGFGGTIIYCRKDGVVCDENSKLLDLEGNNKIDYYIEQDAQGKIKKFVVNNNEYEFNKENIENKNEIKDIIEITKETPKIDVSKINISNSFKKLTDKVIETEGREHGVTNYGIAGYRYSGNDPHNYVKFNGELWRIIGVVDGNQIGKTSGTFYTKMIRVKTELKPYNENNSNVWGKSTLKAYLNSSDRSYANNSMMETSVEWHHASQYYSNIMTSNIYIKEGWNSGLCNETNNTCTKANVGIISPSDYGYASSGCANDIQNLYHYDSSTCKDTNWLVINNSYQWLLMPGISGETWFIDKNGSVWDCDGVCFWESVGQPCDIRAIIFLKSDVIVTEGNGTISNPFNINL